MRKQLKQVKQFHETFDALINKEPATLNQEEFMLRKSLIQEELQELEDAAEAGDLVEVADALGDLLYVVYGTAIAFGLTNHLEECFDEIHRSNMTKTNPDGSVTYREDGKILKSDHYQPPQLKEIVANDPKRLQESTKVFAYWAQGEIDQVRELLIRMFIEKNNLDNDEFTFNENKDGEEIRLTVNASLI